MDCFRQVTTLPAGAAAAPKALLRCWTTSVTTDRHPDRHGPNWPLGVVTTSETRSMTTQVMKSHRSLYQYTLIGDLYLNRTTWQNAAWRASGAEAASRHCFQLWPSRSAGYVHFLICWSKTLLDGPFHLRDCTFVAIHRSTPKPMAFIKINMFSQKSSNLRSWCSAAGGPRSSRQSKIAGEEIECWSCQAFAKSKASWHQCIKLCNF